jgi:hypothetical protein
MKIVVAQITDEQKEKNQYLNKSTKMTKFDETHKKKPQKES